MKARITPAFGRRDDLRRGRRIVTRHELSLILTKGESERGLIHVN